MSKITMQLDQNFKDLITDEVLSISNENSIAPMLLGEPGIGKSSFVRGICEDNGWGFFELLCNQLGDRTDLTGVKTMKEEKKNPDGTTREVFSQVFFPHKAVQDAIEFANANPDTIVVLFLDEINRAATDIVSSVLSFTTAKTIGTEKFPKNIRFIVAGNDKGDIVRLDTAALSRFSCYTIKPSASVWFSVTAKVNPFVKAVLDKNPQLIFCKSTNVVTGQVSSTDDDDDSYVGEYEAFDDAEGFNLFTTPRTISGVNALLNRMSNDKLKFYMSTVQKDEETGEDVSMLQGIIEAHVGNTAFAAELCKEIATNISAQAQASACQIVVPKKPAELKQLALVKDRQSQIALIQQFDNKTLSELIQYLVYQPGVDNSDIIKMIASAYPNSSLDSSVMPNFSKMKASDRLDADNYAALISSGTTIGDGIRSILGD